MSVWIQAFILSEEGADLVEYALLLLMVSLVVVGSLTALGQAVQNLLSGVLPGFPP